MEGLSLVYTPVELAVFLEKVSEGTGVVSEVFDETSEITKPTKLRNKSVQN